MLWCNSYSMKSIAVAWRRAHWVHLHPPFKKEKKIKRFTFRYFTGKTPERKPPLPLPDPALDPMGAWGGPHTTRLTFVHPNGNSWLRLYRIWESNFILLTYMLGPYIVHMLKSSVDIWLKSKVCFF